MNEKPSTATVETVVNEVLHELNLTNLPVLLDQPGYFRVTEAIPVGNGHYLCFIILESAVGEFYRASMLNANLQAIKNAVAEHENARIKTVFIYKGAHMQFKNFTAGQTGFAPYKKNLAGLILLIIGHSGMAAQLAKTFGGLLRLAGLNTITSEDSTEISHFFANTVSTWKAEEV